jgi:hypothetical protein
LTFEGGKLLVGGCPVCPPVSPSIPGFYLPDGNSTLLPSPTPPPATVTTTMSLHTVNVPR